MTGDVAIGVSDVGAETCTIATLRAGARVRLKTWVTVFASNRGNRIIDARPMSLAEVELLILETLPAPNKDSLQLLKLASFGEKITAAGCLRTDANLTAVHGVEGDYDGEQMPMADAAERLRAAGIAALLYTSASHTPEKPRWRVLSPLGQSLSGGPDELRAARKRWVGVLNAILGGVLKSESFALSQSFYFGRLEGRPDPEIVRFDGRCVDEITHPPTPVFPRTTALRDTSRSTDLLRKVKAAVAAGATDDQIYAEFIDHPHAADQKDPERAVRRCIHLARESLGYDDERLLRDMNAKHAVINWRGVALVLTETQDPQNGRRGFELSSFEAFTQLLQNRRHRKQNLARWWLQHSERRDYSGVVFAPQREVPGYYNLWRGFGCRPVPGDCSLFLEMVKEVICSGSKELFEYVLGWAADAIQNPARRPGVVLVLKGEQGTGKGTFAREIGALFGSHFFHATSSRQLIGNFNAHLANVLLVFADEAYYAGDKAGEGVLKAMITEPELPLEFKHKDVVLVQNHVRIIMASNQHWVVPASIDDRRFAVIEVSSKRAQDAAYFAAIHEQQNNGGREALLDLLTHRDLHALDLRKLPQTEARFEQQLRSMPPIQKWWYGRLYSGAVISTRDRWDERVLTDEVLADFVREAQVSGVRRLSTQTELGLELRQLVPDLGRTRRSIDNVRRWFYQFPTLAVCRDFFAKKMRRRIDWPAESAADRQPPLTEY